jgi:hypothetical protein
MRINADSEAGRKERKEHKKGRNHSWMRPEQFPFPQTDLK